MFKEVKKDLRKEFLPRKAKVSGDLVKCMPVYDEYYTLQESLDVTEEDVIDDINFARVMFDEQLSDNHTRWKVLYKYTETTEFDQYGMSETYKSTILQACTKLGSSLFMYIYYRDFCCYDSANFEFACDPCLLRLILRVKDPADLAKKYKNQDRWDDNSGVYECRGHNVIHKKEEWEKTHTKWTGNQSDSE